MSEVIEGKPQLPPGMCFICEQSNPVRYIDTFRDFEGIVREKLDGRKYVCEECVTEFAKKLGFVTPDLHSEVHYFALKEQARADELQHELKKFEDLKSVLDSFGIAKAPKKPAAAKAA